MTYLLERGMREFVVFGAGVPTRGNVHEVAPDAGVLYPDIDPVTVRLGQQTLAGHPRAAYTLGDATDLGTLDDDLVHRIVPGWGSGRPASYSSVSRRSWTTSSWPGPCRASTR